MKQRLVDVQLKCTFYIDIGFKIFIKKKKSLKKNDITASGSDIIQINSDLPLSSRGGGLNVVYTCCVHLTLFSLLE